MKKKTLLLFICLMGMWSISYAQSYNADLVSEVRGDTLVVKNLIDTEGEINSLSSLIESDTDAPDTRVYELKRGTMVDGQALPSLYLIDIQFTTPERPIQIVGAEAGTIVGGTLEDGRPPLIAHAGDQEGTAIITFQGDFTLKNLAAMGGSNQGEEGWWPFGAAAGADSSTVILENVLMEHNDWVFVQSNDVMDLTLHIRDSYFLNMTGQPTRRNGGVYDSENFPLKELVVENTTHVQSAGMMYKFRNHAPERIFVNHNTFVNNTGILFLSRGYEYNMTLTNNLFVNSNTQAYYPGLDDNETDLNHLPHGIINLNYHEGTDFAGEPHGINPDLLPEGFVPADRKVLVDRNGVYWDSRLADIVDFLNDNNIPCDDANCQDITGEEWVTQMITMNSRTQSMFDDDATYPLLTEGDWIMGGEPSFEDMPDLVQTLIDWGVRTAPAGNTELLAKFREPGNEAETGEAENFINFDWPVAPDLSYSNSTYLTAALGGYPLGDLNWFASEKAAWESDKDMLYAELESALNEGRVPTSNEGPVEVPKSIELDQNYPNPFNPSTTITFELADASNITLTIYDALGKKVATIINNQFRNAGPHNVTFDASNLSSGVYYYTLEAGAFSQTRKMTLIK